MNLVKPHFDGKRFHNPNGSCEKSFRELSRMFRERSPAVWPKFISNPPRRRPIVSPAEYEAAITFVGQATFLIQLGAINILTDPIFSKRASPLDWIGPKRVRPPGISIDELPPIHFIVVSHNHYDHLNLPSLRELNRRFSPEFITPLGNGPLRKAGFKKILELDW